MDKNMRDFEEGGATFRNLEITLIRYFIYGFEAIMNAGTFAT